MSTRLLIVDAEPFDREVARKVFAGKYDMQFAISALEAGLVDRTFHPDVVLFEMRTNEEENLSDMLVFTQLHKPPLPLVVVFSHDSIELEKVAREYGAFYCMLRPFNLKELWDVLDAASTHARKEYGEALAMQ